MLSPTGRCQAFAAEADGFVRGEGCGVVLLKRLSHARADGDRILCLLRGSAVNQDGRSNGLTAPNALAQQAVLRLALADAQLAPPDLDYVEAHGTGTALGDPIEMGALAAVFAPDATASAAARRLGEDQHRTPGRRGRHRRPDQSRPGPRPPAAAAPPALPAPQSAHRLALPVEIVRQATPWTAAPPRRRAGVSSFGFGGTNAHVILEEAPHLAANRPSASAGGGPAGALRQDRAALAAQAAQWPAQLSPSRRWPTSPTRRPWDARRCPIAWRWSVTIRRCCRSSSSCLPRHTPRPRCSRPWQRPSTGWPGSSGKVPCTATPGSRLATQCPTFRQHWDRAKQEGVGLLFSRASDGRHAPRAARGAAVDSASGRGAFLARDGSGSLLDSGTGPRRVGCRLPGRSPVAARRPPPLVGRRQFRRGAPRCAAQFAYQRPSAPLLSAGRGTWVTEQVATSDYWSVPLTSALLICMRRPPARGLWSRIHRTRDSSSGPTPR